MKKGILARLFGFGGNVAEVETAKRQAPKPNRKRGARGRRNFASGDSDTLFENFVGIDESIDEVLLRQLPKMRARSQKLAADSDYAKKFFGTLRANVIGPEGIALVPKARVAPGGDLDAGDNKSISRAWSEWCKRANCTVAENLHFREVEKQCLIGAARDGEFLLRMVPGFDNKFGLALQLLDPANLDLQLNQRLTNGRQIRLGVEKNEWGAPTAYYFRDVNGSVLLGGNRGPYSRIPAEQIIHGFLHEWIGQTRGVPWTNTAIRSLKMLDGWLEAELVGARVASSKMGFYTSPDGDEYQADDEDADGTLVQEVSPGTFEQLPSGMKVEKFDADYPNSSVSEFVKVTLRSASAGMGIAYNTLANDLESVNYSSLRAGTLEDRDNWRTLQTWISEVLHDRVFAEFLRMALLKGAFDRPLKPSKIEKYSEHAWQPRGWSWVDPLKDIQAAERSIALGLTDRAAIATAQGNPDLEGTIKQLGAENLLAAESGVNVAGLGAAVEKEAAEPPKPKNQT